MVAVHSLSKRSNLAGVRVGLLRRRPRAGRLPARGAPARRAHGARARSRRPRRSPWPTTTTSRRSGRRYRERLAFLAGVLDARGCPVALPDGGFYLWVPVPPALADGWALAEALAAGGGLLVSPGDLYGAAGAGHVRVAVVQPMERLALVGGARSG